VFLTQVASRLVDFEQQKLRQCSTVYVHRGRVGLMDSDALATDVTAGVRNYKYTNHRDKATFMCMWYLEVHRYHLTIISVTFIF
jgi:hypothetical protein